MPRPYAPYVLQAIPRLHHTDTTRKWSVQHCDIGIACITQVHSEAGEVEVEEGALGAAVGLVEEEGAPEAPLQEVGAWHVEDVAHTIASSPSGCLVLHHTVGQLAARLARVWVHCIACSATLSLPHEGQPAKQASQLLTSLLHMQEDLGVASEGHPVAVAFVVEADDRPPTLAMVSNSFNTAAATARHVGFMLVLLPYGSTSAAELT